MTSFAVSGCRELSPSQESRLRDTGPAPRYRVASFPAAGQDRPLPLNRCGLLPTMSSRFLVVDLPARLLAQLPEHHTVCLQARNVSKATGQVEVSGGISLFNREA